MSKARDPPRGFFPFGNPFRMLSPKGSDMSPKLLSLLNTFEVTLAERMKKLMPKGENDILSLSWMKAAMESLSETHNDIKVLITALELPISDWDDKWVDMYLDISKNLLDICIGFTSELTRLNQGHLLLQFVLHNLDSNTPDRYMRARSSVDSWKQHISSGNPRVKNCCPILDSLVRSVNLPKVKNSAKGKVLMRALLGVKVHTVFVCSVFAVGFSDSPKNLLSLNISDKLLWAKTYSELQTVVNGELTILFSSGNGTVLKELDAVQTSVKELYPMIQGDIELIELESFNNCVSELGGKADKLSQGLDLVTKEVDGFFKVLLNGRDALLGNLRSTGVSGDVVVGKNGESQVVR